MGLAGDRCVAPPRRSTPGSPSSSRLALASQYPCARPFVLSPRAATRMIYLKNSIGIELRGEDMVVTCLSSNFSGEVFTHFKRVAGYRARERAEVRAELEQFFRTRRLGRDNIVLGLPRADALIRHLDLPREVEDNLAQVVLYQVQSLEPSEDEKFHHDYV